jgi:hypothetical protein
MQTIRSAHRFDCSFTAPVASSAAWTKAAPARKAAKKAQAFTRAHAFAIVGAVFVLAEAACLYL